MTGAVRLRLPCSLILFQCCDALPLCRFREPVTGRCARPFYREEEQEDTGVLSGRYWT